MNEKDWVKVTFTVCVVTLISFWVVVIAGGIYINRAVTTIKEAQENIETAVDSLQEIDVTDINKTVEALQDAGDALSSLVGIVTGSDDSEESAGE